MLGSIMTRRAMQQMVRTQQAARQLSQGKNRIQEFRTKYYSNPATGADNPTYLKEPGDKVMVGIAFTGLTIGLVCIFKGLYNMSFGINKVPQ